MAQNARGSNRQDGITSVVEQAMTASGYFSQNYAEARGRFLEACRA